MEAKVLKEIRGLRYLTVTGLRARYREVFGEESRSNHKQFLVRRVAWRLQELAEGGLSERARRRAMEIANDADFRIRAPKVFPALDGEASERTYSMKIDGKRDPRLPKAGTLLTREYEGRCIVVKVNEDNFEFEGGVYRSLSRIAQQVTGTKWNGFAFFGLAKESGRGA